MVITAMQLAYAFISTFLALLFVCCPSSSLFLVLLPAQRLHSVQITDSLALPHTLKVVDSLKIRMVEVRIRLSC